MKNTIKVILICFFLLGTGIMLYGMKTEPELTLAEQWNYDFGQTKEQADEIVRRNRTDSLEITYKISQLEDEGYEVRDYYYGECKYIADKNYITIQRPIYDKLLCFIVER